MFYQKNLPAVERAARAVAGMLLLVGGPVGFKGAPLGYVAAAMGLVALVTGWVGFCPMCAMVGRKPVAKSPGEAPKS